MQSHPNTPISNTPEATITQQTPEHNTTNTAEKSDPKTPESAPAEVIMRTFIDYVHGVAQLIAGHGQETKGGAQRALNFTKTFVDTIRSPKIPLKIQKAILQEALKPVIGQTQQKSAELAMCQATLQPTRHLVKRCIKALSARDPAGFELPPTPKAEGVEKGDTPKAKCIEVVDCNPQDMDSPVIPPNSIALEIDIPNQQNEKLFIPLPNILQPIPPLSRAGITPTELASLTVAVTRSGLAAKKAFENTSELPTLAQVSGTFFENLLTQLERTNELSSNPHLSKWIVSIVEEVLVTPSKEELESNGLPPEEVQELLEAIDPNIESYIAKSEFVKRIFKEADVPMLELVKAKPYILNTEKVTSAVKSAQEQISKFLPDQNFSIDASEVLKTSSQSGEVPEVYSPQEVATGNKLYQQEMQIKFLQHHYQQMMQEHQRNQKQNAEAKQNDSSQKPENEQQQDEAKEHDMPTDLGQTPAPVQEELPHPQRDQETSQGAGQSQLEAFTERTQSGQARPTQPKPSLSAGEHTTKLQDARERQSENPQRSI